MAEPNKNNKRAHPNPDNHDGDKKIKEKKENDIEYFSDSDSNMDINEDSIIPASFTTAIENKTKQKKFLLQGLELNFGNTNNEKRLPRQAGGQLIDIKEDKHADVLIKWKIIAIAGILGWSPSSPKTTENKKIAEAAINLVCYDNGIVPVGYRTFCKWTDAIDESLHGIKTNLGTDLLERKKKTNTKYRILIKKEAPGYILSMFWKAQRVLGVEATFVELAETMNWLSLKENDKPELKFKYNILFS